MSRLDWREVLTEHRVHFIESGANVRRGELNIRCPFCGSADPSEHLGLNLDTGHWSCWRNRAEHSGKSPVRLLMKLLHVSHPEAMQIAGLDASYVDPDGFQAMVHRMRAAKVESPTPEAALLHMKGFERISDYGLTRRHYGYLDNRWFDPVHLSEWYSVMAGIDGVWKDRVIFPYYENKELVTWTGRAIGAAEVRYRDLPIRAPYEAYNGPLARVPAKETLFNHDCMLKGGRWLILQEGPVDALKIDVYGRDWNVRSVGLSTASISDGQMARLDMHAHNFDHIGVMMDNANTLDIVDSMTMQARVRSVHKSVHVLRVPNGKKDGGELKPREVDAFCADLINRRIQ